MQIYQALDWAKSLGIEAIDRQILLLHCLGQPTHNKAFLISHDLDALTLEQESNYSQLIKRCSAGEPVSYLTGSKEFYGLDFKVTPATLIPRPDTETLVNWALDCMSGDLDISSSPRKILDLGTGSGCIAISLGKSITNAQVWATDLSEIALEVARENAATHRLKIHFCQGSWFDALGKEQSSPSFDLIISNPPYIAELDPHLADLAFEPKSALVSGEAGLDAFKKILSSTHQHLKPGGWLLFEHGYDQGATLRALFEQLGFESVQSRSDLAGICRCTGGKRPKNGIIEP